MDNFENKSLTMVRGARSFRRKSISVLSELLVGSSVSMLHGDQWREVGNLPAWVVLSDADLQRLTYIAGVSYLAGTLSSCINGKLLREVYEHIGEVTFFRIIEESTKHTKEHCLTAGPVSIQSIYKMGVSVLIGTVVSSNMKFVLSKRFTCSPEEVSTELAESLYLFSEKIRQTKSMDGGIIGTGDTLQVVA